MLSTYIAASHVHDILQVAVSADGVGNANRLSWKWQLSFTVIAVPIDVEAVLRV